MLNLEAFLGGLGSTTSDYTVTASRLGLKEGGFAYPQAYAFAPASNSRMAYPSASPHRTLERAQEY